MPKDIAQISLKDGIQVFFKTINDYITHADYDIVTAIAEDYQIFITGEGASKKLLQFTPRESVEQFAQRVRLTQITTPDIAGGCTKYMYKVGRTPAGKVITWGDAQKNEENKKSLMDVAGKFYGKQSVDQYLTNRMVELDSTDPNSFIVVEFTTLIDGVVDPKNPESKAIPYPFEVNSREAVNFTYKNNLLQFLVVKNDFLIKDKDGKDVWAFKYTIYLSENSIVAKPLHRDTLDDWKKVNPGYEEISELQNQNVEMLAPEKVYLFISKEKGNKKERYFEVRIYEHKIGFVPAQRVGTVRDLTTRGRTRVPLIHNAKAYFEKVIKAVSELDITMVMHVFPQKVQYSESCPGYLDTIEGSEDTVLIGCIRGHTADGKKCKACDGHGFVVHKSASDIIQIAMPKDLRDLVSLENIIVYKYPPTDLLEFQKKLALYEYRALAQRAVYNSESFTSEQIMSDKTATGENIDLDRVYDTLKPFADNYSEMWVFVMTCIAQLRDLGTDLQIVHQFPNDFKMKSLTQLLDDLKKASDSGAPSHVKKAINRDIVRKYYIDDPDEILRLETKDRYSPFPGKTDAQIQYIFTNNDTTNKLRVFFNHFDLIFTQLEFDAMSKNPAVNFYKMEEKLQRELIDKKVDEFVKEIQEEAQQAMKDAFKAAQDTGAGDGTEEPAGPDNDDPTAAAKK